MELRKYFYKSYHSKPKVKLKNILNDNIFFKKSLILKLALNKNIKINTNYRIDRLKTDKNITNSKNHDNNEDSYENRYEKMLRKKNLLYELEKILEKNEKKTEKFVESFKDLKEENNKFMNGYDDIKIPVEDRIKRFILNTIKLFNDNDIKINFRSKGNNKSNLIENQEDDLNDLWAQNKAALKLFKQCPLTLNDEKEIYFYYISNYLGEKLNINDHKYIKYLNQIKEYLDDIKNEKSSPSPVGEKDKKKKRRKTQLLKKEITKNNDKEEENKRLGITKNIKKINFNKRESTTKIILDGRNQSDDNGGLVNINLLNNKSNNNNSEHDSKNKNTSRNNNINSTQEFPSKDNVNLVSISNYENKNNNIYNIYKNNLIKNYKLNDLSFINTPNNKRFSYIRNNLKMKKKIYLNTCNNKNNRRVEEFKNKEELNKCKSTKKFSPNFNNKTSFQDTNYTMHRIPSENLSNIKNSLSKINMKKQVSTKLIKNYEKYLSRNSNKMATMNLFKEIKINGKNNNIIDILKDKDKNKNHKSSKNIGPIKSTEENDISSMNTKNDTNNLLNLYEKAKKSNLLNDKSLNEINEYLKMKGIKNDDILKGIQFNSDNVFINLKSKTNKLNIEAKTKAFFYGIIPNDRKRKLEQLKNINNKISQIERDYIKTLIDKDLKFNK